MKMFPKLITLSLSVSVLAGAAFAAVDQESVTVTANGIAALTADLDPLKDFPDGVTGERIARDINKVDRYDAYRAFARGLSGPLEETYDWHGLRDDGQFIPTRQFDEAGLLCRDFTEETAHHGTEGFDPKIGIEPRSTTVFGTACRERDGWHFR